MTLQKSGFFKMRSRRACLAHSIWYSKRFQETRVNWGSGGGSEKFNATNLMEHLKVLDQGGGGKLNVVATACIMLWRRRPCSERISFDLNTSEACSHQILSMPSKLGTLCQTTVSQPSSLAHQCKIDTTAGKGEVRASRAPYWPGWFEAQIQSCCTRGSKFGRHGLAKW